jgi:hypothetical protein
VCRVLTVISLRAGVIIAPYRMLDAGTVVWSIVACCGEIRSRFNATGGVERVLLLE